MSDLEQDKAPEAQASMRDCSFGLEMVLIATMIWALFRISRIISALDVGVCPNRCLLRLHFFLYVTQMLSCVFVIVTGILLGDFSSHE